MWQTMRRACEKLMSPPPSPLQVSLFLQVQLLTLNEPFHIRVRAGFGIPSVYVVRIGAKIHSRLPAPHHLVHVMNTAVSFVIAVMLTRSWRRGAKTPYLTPVPRDQGQVQPEKPRSWTP